MTWAIPVAANLIKGSSEKSAADFNAGVLKQEGQAAFGQSVLEEGLQRRSARESLGRTSAAIGEAGIGYGGSAANVMDEAAVKAELDALNIRYKGAFTKYGYDQQSRLEKKRGRMALISGGLNAGSSLLTSSGGSYT